MKRTDRDRVMMNIAVETAGSVFDQMTCLKGGWTLRTRFGDPAPQFVPLSLAQKLHVPLTEGDIVRCCTNPHHPWGIAEMVEYVEHDTSLLREIGGTRLCNMSNERYDVLRFMSPHLLYTGKKYQLYLWAYKAFHERYNPDADYLKRCGGIEFKGDQMHIWSRPHVWAQFNKDGQHRQPRRFTLTWGPKTRLKDVITAMRDQGFALPFDTGPEEPTQGMAGCARFTRQSLVEALNLVQGVSIDATTEEPAKGVAGSGSSHVYQEKDADE